MNTIKFRTSDSKKQRCFNLLRPWIGFLDADVIPHPDWVETALELIRNNPSAGAFEGRTEVIHRVRATPFTHQTENTEGGRYLTCNLIVRKNLAHFHQAYKIPFREDTDLAFSILESGYKIIFASELTVSHRLSSQIIAVHLS